MAVGAYMVSILRRQWLLLGQRFLREHPHCWLVWEPGPWRPASSVEMANQARTLEPGTEAPCRPAGEDAICFELTLKPGQTALEVGRSTESDVVINDLTASRSEFTLAWRGAGWVLLTSSPNLRLNRQALEPMAASALVSGDRLKVGDVELTFYEARCLAKRLQKTELALAL